MDKELPVAHIASELLIIGYILKAAFVHHICDDYAFLVLNWF